MQRLKYTEPDDTDTTRTNGSYYFSSWSNTDRLVLRGLYKRYACPKVHLMKKIEESGRGRSCGRWPMWRTMAKALLSEVGKKITPKKLHDFFWDVIGRGSDVTATLDQLLGLEAVSSSLVLSRAVVPKLNVKPARRSSATTSWDDRDKGRQKTASRRPSPRRTAKNEELPLDLTLRPPQHDEVKEKPLSCDEQCVLALFYAMMVEGGAANESALLPASVASLDNEGAPVLGLMPAQISIANGCQPDASAVNNAFAVCPYDGGLVGVEPMFSDGSGAIAGASPERPPPPVQRVDKEVQCELDSTLLFETMMTEHLRRMDDMRRQLEALMLELNGPLDGVQ
ncbi:hypothetical protein HPB48_008390 [Haemaphysalis longicornis]|uniref:Uncharacterized protein n=1 Tax=Haemaphysalis longicornis TaxID=44386 RepID=A0A9J6FCN0_HAELO|nr:hypothetical protein HPB48_008390 [Haemaphysalis longicornis]